MNLAKKVLIAHEDPKLKRTLVLLLADAGYDVRAHVAAPEALERAREEWFDLALIGEHQAGTSGLAVFESLKKIQPTLPIALLAKNPDLALIIKSIRLGLVDVLPVENDLAALARRVRAHLEPGAKPPLCDAATEAELTAVETALTTLNAVPAEAKDWRQELLRLTRERAEWETQVQRLAHEKAALEAELKTLLAQNADAIRQARELESLRTQREMAAATQVAIDAKARALAEQRENIARERYALEAERRHAAQSTPALPPWATDAAEMEAMRERMHAEEQRLRELALQLQQEAAQVARERRRWHDDLDLLREQEKNLRDYEERLRKLQAQLEADRVVWFSHKASQAEQHPARTDDALREAWQKIQRASELLEAERAHVRDDRLCVREHEAALTRREQQLAAKEAKLAALEKQLLAPAPHKENSPESVRLLSRSPLEMARSVFTGGKR